VRTHPHTLKYGGPPCHSLDNQIFPMCVYNPGVAGKLKIFLGYADGVGKTYAMLEAARQRKAEGVDVAAAWVETHEQVETDALNAGYDVIPPRISFTSGSPVAEMDIDAVLARRPQLALVDDLAHANPPGSRHPNRWQDAVELLETGMDVYCTLNVQNVESLTDAVRQITGLVVTDTVPDSLLDEADQIELVDLPADELLNRFRQGKIQGPAVETFFRMGNLTALREMAMRRAAMRVDDQMRGYLDGAPAETRADVAWAAERVLVAISSHPLSERLVRAGRRLADSLNAEWLVVFVETPGHLQMTSEQRDRLLNTLRSAEELGARAVMLTGESVPETLIEFAIRERVTRLVIGRPAVPGWRELLRGSLVDRILRLSGSIDVFVVSGSGDEGPVKLGKAWNLRTSISRLLASIGLVALVTVLGLALTPWMQPVALAMFFLTAVVVAGAYLGRGPSVMTALLSALSFAYYFTEPRYQITLDDAPHLITLVGLLVVGLVVSGLSTMLRDQVRAARLHEEQSVALNALSRDLTVALGLEEMLASVVRNVAQTFSREVAVLLQGDGTAEAVLAVRASTPGLTLSSKAMETAGWTFQRRKQSGIGTDTHPDAGVRCLPLETREGVVGVLAVAPREAGRILTPEERQLLEGFASLAALAIERAQLSEQARQAAMLRTTERLQTALLNSISHDLRTPLSAITGAVSSLLEAEESGLELGRASRLDLLENAQEEAERLNRLVGNLLDMTRIEAGAMKMKLRPGDVQDVIGAALERAARRLDGRKVITDIASGLPAVCMDFVLMVQVLFNLLDNAVKYSPEETPVEVQACGTAGGIEIRVRDHGLGIPEEDLERVFTKFYRVQRSNGTPGTGLGLSICRGIIEGMGGAIRAENCPDGGAVMVVGLPYHAEELLEPLTAGRNSDSEGIETGRKDER
jgi:two-component system, OmpR family, sensor histidine kinase KdpD